LTGKDHSRFVAALAAERVIAILRCSGAAQAVESAKALIAEGIRIIEVSLNTPGAVKAIEELSAYCANIPGAVIGAGTVLDAGTVERVGAAGARFFVAPTFDFEAVAVANEYGMAPIPGCATPTEMLRAHRAGAAAIKVFPATLWTPEGLQNVVRAMPFLQLIPTGGVGIGQAPEWLAAGAAGLGIGSALAQAKNVRQLKEAISPFLAKDIAKVVHGGC
jgi:2-dehydro-3-deoxyphosphogluconate aldolase / (4S)-4-hydroxy-2-oxoglutarate aldolase